MKLASTLKKNRKQPKQKNKAPRFFENYTTSYKTFEQFRKLNKSTTLDMTINNILDYLYDEDYFKSEIELICTVNDKCKGRNAKIVVVEKCVCQKTRDIPPKKFTKKSSITRNQFLAVVDHIIEKIFTKYPQVMGSQCNVFKYKKNVRNALSFTKDQHIKPSLLTRRLKLASTAWLEFTGTHFSETPQNKLFADFCLDLFSIIRYVLLRHFYIGVTRLSQPVVYLKRSWHGLVHLHENMLREKLTPAESPNPMARKIRWIPKTQTSSLRPIFLHRKDKKDRDNYETVNFILKSVLLGSEVGLTRTTTKPSNHFLSKWKTFRSDWCERNSPKMFVVKTDLEDAYGNVNQRTLLDTVTKWLLKVFSSYSRLTLYRSYNRRRHSRVYWFKEVPSTLPKLSGDYGNPKLIRVFIGEQLIFWVEKYLRELFQIQVKIGRKCFQYSSGILQGHPLSGYLCEIYYGEIYLNHHLKLLSETTKPTLLLSAMDDMMFLTADKSLALKYLNFIQDEDRCPVKMNSAKLESNFCPLDEKCTAGAAGTHHKKLFSFCGVSIDAHTLNISGSYYNYQGRNIFHSFTFKSANESYIRVIETKLNFFLSLKTHRMFFDIQINCIVTIVRNIFELGVHLACRFNSLTINLCIEDSSQFRILQSTLSNLSVHIAKKLHWRSYVNRQTRVLLILTDALVFITHRYDTLYEIDRIQLKLHLNSLLSQAKHSVRDKQLESWLLKFKTRSLVPRMLMKGT